ncbi:hypothetical protein FRX31_028027, partial [Thalictrum thalictroides]
MDAQVKRHHQSLFCRVLTRFPIHFRHHHHAERNKPVKRNETAEMIKKILEYAHQVPKYREMKSVNESADQCPVCLETWEEEEGKQKWILPNCRHAFHEECICQW